MLNSLPYIVVNVPSAHSAVRRLRPDPDSQVEVAMPTPRHANPPSMRACLTPDADGLAYATETRSLYREGVDGTVTSRSNDSPSKEPTFLHRTLPPGSAPPVVSVAWAGMRVCPVYTTPPASVHSMATAGLEAGSKSALTAALPHGPRGREGYGGGDGGLIGGMGGGGADGACCA